MGAVAVLWCMLSSTATADAGPVGGLDAALLATIGEVWSVSDGGAVDSDATAESQIRDVLWTVKTADTPKTRPRLQQVLSTWYRMIPPEQFALIVGVPGGEPETPTAALLDGLHPDSILLPLCSSTHGREDLMCKTALNVELGKLLAAMEPSHASSRSAPLDLKAGLAASSPAMARDALSQNAYGRGASTTFHGDRVPKWFCTFDDDVYVHADRLAGFLATLNHSAPQVVGPFCSVPTACCHGENGTQGYNSAFHNKHHTCGSSCWSVGLLEAANRADRELASTLQGDSNHDCGRDKTYILPNTTFDYRRWQMDGHQLNCAQGLEVGCACMAHDAVN